MKIYLVRHGETTWNKEGKIQGWQNSDLTNKGIEDAKALGRYLKDIDFKCAYTSPFQRAIDTTKYIIENRDIDININLNFRELNFGCWEGRRFNEVQDEYPEQHYNLWNNPAKYSSIDGENLEDFRNRVKKGLDEVIDSKKENILLVTHALVVKAIYSIVRNLPVEEIWNSPKIGNTSFTILEVDKDIKKIKILKEASTEHLEEISI